MRKYYHFEKIDSTSSYLKSNYDKYDDLTFVSADFQENGHGRNKRKWYSKNKEDLLFSVLIKDKELINKFDVMSLCSATIIYEVLKENGVENIKIKWPNDVFVGNKKISGVLLESVSYGGNIHALVLGVGINVNSSFFEKGMINEPTSIFLETNKKRNINDFKNVVYSKFIEMFNNIKKGDNSYLDIIRKNNYLKGKKAYAYINNKKELVEVIDINEDNTLKIKLGEDVINICSGEITFNT